MVVGYEINALRFMKISSGHLSVHEQRSLIRLRSGGFEAILLYAIRS